MKPDSNCRLEPRPFSPIVFLVLFESSLSRLGQPQAYPGRPQGDSFIPGCFPLTLWQATVCTVPSSWPRIWRGGRTCTLGIRAAVSSSWPRIWRGGRTQEPYPRANLGSSWPRIWRGGRTWISSARRFRRFCWPRIWRHGNDKSRLESRPFSPIVFLVLFESSLSRSGKP